MYLCLFAVVPVLSLFRGATRLLNISCVVALFAWCFEMVQNIFGRVHAEYGTKASLLLITVGFWYLHGRALQALFTSTRYFNCWCPEDALFVRSQTLQLRAVTPCMRSDLFLRHQKKRALSPSYFGQIPGSWKSATKKRCIQCRLLPQDAHA